MAREYFHAYHSYLEAMEALGDAECGRLFKACLLYSKTGEAPELSGNERILFPSWRSQIDRDDSNYEEKCLRNKQNGAKGGSKRNQPPADGTQRQQPVADGTQRQRSVADGTQRPPNAPQGKGKGKGEGKGEGEGKERNKSVNATAARLSKENSSDGESFGRAYSYFLDNIAPSLSQAAAYEMRDFCDSLGAELVMHAIDKTAEQSIDKWKWSYTKAILSAWEREGVKSAEDVNRRDVQRKQGKYKRSGKASGPEEPPVNIEDDLERMQKILEQVSKG